MKESIYDEKISPLMTEIIKICKENNIDMLASFKLDWSDENESYLKCTTLIAPDCKEFQKAVKFIKNEPEYSAFVISTSKDET